MGDARRCEILHGFELHPCRGIAEGMDDKGVLVCRPCGQHRKMTGGEHVGWFGETPAERKKRAAHA